jgi:hypothetical protein
VQQITVCYIYYHRSKFVDYIQFNEIDIINIFVAFIILIQHLLIIQFFILIIIHINIKIVHLNIFVIIKTQIHILSIDSEIDLYIMLNRFEKKKQILFRILIPIVKFFHIILKTSQHNI